MTATAILVLSVARVPAASPQDRGGTITGSVTSSITGVALPNVSVSITNVATGGVTKTASGSDGTYTLPPVSPGTYHLLVTIPNQCFDYRKTIAIVESQALKIDAVLSSPGGACRPRSAAAPTAPVPPSGPTPRIANGTPDLSGLWSRRFADGSFGDPDLLPAAEAIVEERLATLFKDHPAARCLPSGVSVGLGPGASRFRLVQKSDVMVALKEGDVRTFREIFLDGRRHPSDPNPTWLGHSVGAWDGDTLVVDTIGFSDRVWIDLPFTSGLPTTERLHVIERYTRPDVGHLNIEVTIDDPGAYRRPWTATFGASLTPNDTIDENICNENEKDSAHLVGK